MFSAYRCTNCSTNWPPTGEFAVCPECGDNSSPMGQAVPIDVAVAVSRKRHAEFERFYAEREAARMAAELESV